MMVGNLYGLRVASMLPAVWTASVLIAYSSFTRPYSVLGGIVAAWSFVTLVVHWMVKPPHWELFSRSALTVALICEFVSAFALAGIAVLMLYIYRRLSDASDRNAAHG